MTLTFADVYEGAVPTICKAEEGSAEIRNDELAFFMYDDRETVIQIKRDSATLLVYGIVTVQITPWQANQLLNEWSRQWA